MGSVWVRAQGDVLVRADAIVVLALGPEGLRAECGAGAAVRLTGTPCSTALMLGLAEVIDRAGRARQPGRDHHAARRAGVRDLAMGIR